MTVYAIDWGDGTSIRVGRSREYAERLLREASGPFLAKNPAPRVVEVPEPTTQEKPMTSIPTPAEFLATSEPDEEEHPVDHPLGLIADSLRRMADAAERQVPVTAVLEATACTECERYRAEAIDLANAYDEAGSRAVNAEALVEQIEGIVKKSTSKVSLDVKAAIEAWRNPADPETPSPAPDADQSEPAVDDAAGTGAPAPDVQPASAKEGPMYAPTDDASVEEWRAWARSFGYTGPDVDTMNRSQIRTMLGIEQPVAPAGA